MKSLGVLCLLAAGLLSSGCATLVSNAATSFGNNLTDAILNQDDPELVRAGMPSYILLLDSFLQGNPDSPALLSTAASMYASYGAVFADDERRASRLTTRARNYGLEAMCQSYADACGWPKMRYKEFVLSLEGVTKKHSDVLYVYGFATLAFLRAHSSDLNSLAEVPHAEALFEHYFKIDDVSANGAAHTYYASVLTLRPPALGGDYDKAQYHFERAIEISQGRDLGAKVAYARDYARQLYIRDLHDRLLNEVLQADPYADGLTLTNVMAQDEAKTLLDDADDHF
ncbi:MAG: hypothetical protein IIA07_07355 [Proteobacteria bacterium]|nr:hypothetical protein [Pseudomonadota bacterium]